LYLWLGVEALPLLFERRQLADCDIKGVREMC
jgi:hypothetical protein